MSEACCLTKVPGAIGDPGFEPSDVELLRRAEGTIQAQAERLKLLEGVLEANEWNGSEIDHRCPECHESRAAGHTKTCAYGAALCRTGAQMCAVGAGC